MSSAITKPFSSAELLQFLQKESAVWANPNLTKVAYQTSLTNSIKAISTSILTISDNNNTQFRAFNETLMKVKLDIENLESEKLTTRMAGLNKRITDLAESIIVNSKASPIAASNALLYDGADDSDGALLSFDEFQDAQQRNQKGPATTKASVPQQSTATTIAASATAPSIAASAPESGVQEIIRDIDAGKIDNLESRFANLSLKPGKVKDSILNPWAQALIKKGKLEDATRIILQISDSGLREARDAELIANLSRNEPTSKEADKKEDVAKSPVTTLQTVPPAVTAFDIQDTFMGKLSRVGQSAATSVKASVAPTPAANPFEESFQKFQASLEESFQRALNEDNIIEGLQPLLNILKAAEKK